MTATSELRESARPAVAEDLPTLTALFHSGIEEQRDARGGELWEKLEVRPSEIEADLGRSMESDDALVVVGTLDDVVVGYGSVEAVTLRTEERLARVRDLFVDPGARKVGLGEAMMDLLVDQATVWGAIGIDTVVLPGNRDTKNFFESYGLVARSLTVHRDLR